MLTRDSRWWWVGILLPVLVELFNAVVANPAQFGIPAEWLPIIRLVTLLIGLVSAKLATSPLRAKSDADIIPFR